jgi:hypothetical protein
MAENICGSICRELLCELEANHRGKHRFTGKDSNVFITWTDAGAKKITKDKMESNMKGKK